MDSNSVNSVIDNICDKLGTTLDVLIPEMAGYSIARWSIWLVLSCILIGVGIAIAVHIIRMYKCEDEYRLIDTKHLHELKEKDTIDYKDIMWWVTGIYHDESEYAMWWMFLVMIGLSGITIFCIAISKIIGWSMAPHAMMFEYIVNQIGG